VQQGLDPAFDRRPERPSAVPELRLGKGLARSRTDWDTALDHAASVFARTIAEHGPDSVAFYISGQLLTEDYYAFNKLARALVGTNNIDSNSRLCMSSAVVGYKRSLGADAPPCSYEDLESSDCVMIVGSNMAYAHPVLFRRLEEAKSRRPQMKVIVIDPRRTDTCDLADLHLAILPGTDVALFHGILHLLLWEDRVDRDFIKAHTKVCGTQASGARLHAFDGCATVRDQRRAAAPVRRMGRYL
jgi:assimilatory nitrate reductase catalytic subunit